MQRLLFGNSTWTSPYVLSCFVTLRVKGLPFEIKPVALDVGAQHEPAFATQSLTSRVPVLVEGDIAISESSAIVEYLDERYAPPEYERVLPEDLVKRARARQIMAWVRSDLMPIREERSAECVFYPHDQIPPLAALSEKGRRAKMKLLTAAQQLIPDGGGHLFGAWSIADTDLAMMLQRLLQTESDIPEKIRAFAERQWQHFAVKEFCAAKRPPFAASI